MPGPLIHTHIAEEVFKNLKEVLDIESQRIRSVFIQGTLAPDMGVFPGSEPIISDLAHFYLTGDLVNNLISEAEREEEKAFAWGWATHHIADTLIHPVVNKQVGLLLYGDLREVYWSEDKASHLRAEIGLDGYMFQKLKMKSPGKEKSCLNQELAKFLSRSYLKTYNFEIKEEQFLKAHIIGLNYNDTLGKLAQIIGSRFFNVSFPKECLKEYLSSYLVLKAFKPLWPSSSYYGAIARAVRPKEELVTLALKRIEEAIKISLGAILNKEPLKNIELDTGRPEEEPEREESLMRKETRASIGVG